jgi:hypothetical protein
MISTCEPFSNFDAISWMVTMSWDSHDRFFCGIHATQLKRLHQTSEISSIYIHGETNNGVSKLSMGPDKPEKDWQP